jgi:hypothetical protein
LHVYSMTNFHRSQRTHKRQCGPQSYFQSYRCLEITE